MGTDTRASLAATARAVGVRLFPFYRRAPRGKLVNLKSEREKEEPISPSRVSRPPGA